jgi:ABC-type enterochelin transport system substrate-binding protein
LSSATLSKHLKELEKGVVEKQVRLDSGEYPYPVFYRIKEPYQTLFEVFNIQDARKFRRNTKVDEKKLEKEMQAYLESITQALSRSVKEALNIYANDRNVKAFQQSAGTALTIYTDAVQAVQGEIGRHEKANHKARRS